MLAKNWQGQRPGVDSSRRSEGGLVRGTEFVSIDVVANQDLALMVRNQRVIPSDEQVRATDLPWGWSLGSQVSADRGRPSW